MKETNIRYIEDNKNYGIEYDYTKIKREYSALKIPREYWRPNIAAMKGNNYSLIMSERSRAKTTNVILLGLIMNKLYGTQVCYLRDTKQESVKDVVMDMLNVIIDPEWGYIEKLTDGEWDTIIYKHMSKRFYYARYERNENGQKKEKIGDIAESPCIIVMTVEKAIDYKSGFNNPLADFIVFDECTKRKDRPESFPDLMDLLATIKRERKSMRVFLLTNTIAPNSTFYAEMMIQKDVRKMRKGEFLDIMTPLGVHIHVEMLADAVGNENRLNSLLSYFGFNNPRLSSITGVDEWSLDYYKHIPPKKDLEDITALDSFFIELNSYQLSRVDIVEYMGHICLFVYPFTTIPKSDMIFTLSEDRIDDSHHYALGSKKIMKLVETCVKMKYCFYATNEIGNDFENYVEKCRSIMGSIII